MSFKYVPIEIVSDDGGADLIEEYAKLAKLHAETGDEAEHGHTIVCQIFAHRDSDRKFFISGRVLNKDESLALAKILGSELKRLPVQLKGDMKP